MLEMETQEMDKQVISIWEKVPRCPFVLYIGKKKLSKTKYLCGEMNSNMVYYQVDTRAFLCHRKYNKRAKRTGKPQWRSCPNGARREK